MIKDGDVIEIVKANYLGEYRIELYFSDGTTQEVDFEGFIKSSQHPEIKKYSDTGLFREFEIIDGDIVWNDYDLCFPIADLYENSVSVYTSVQGQHG
jgi:hypothetical protein